MEIVELTGKEYNNMIHDNIPVFSKLEFLELNRDKVDKIHFLAGKDKKIRILLAIGEKDGEWRAPFSAPFSNIIIVKKDTSIEYLWEFITLLVSYVKTNNGKLISIYMPADIYGAQDNSRIYNALLGNGFNIEYVDVNYSFDLDSFDLDGYEQLMHYNARKNLRIAMSCDNRFIRCETQKEKEEAYDIIKINREARGFPLRMTKEQVMATIEVVNHDFFLVKNNETTIASAIVYRLTSKIAQVVYWGDVPGVGQYKPINFMSYNLVKYYKELGYQILDIGISTENGIPNYGLCNFKESLGCIPSTKIRMKIDL